MVELGQELSLNDRPHFCLFADGGDFSGTIKQVHPLARGSYLLDVKEEAYTHTQGGWWRGSIRMMTALIVYNLPPSRSTVNSKQTDCCAISTDYCEIGHNCCAISLDCCAISTWSRLVLKLFTRIAFQHHATNGRTPQFIHRADVHM